MSKDKMSFYKKKFNDSRDKTKWAATIYIGVSRRRHLLYI